MPRVIHLADDAACTLGDCVAALQDRGFDPEDEASLMHVAGWLRQLGNNRDFLADLLLEELKGRHRLDDTASSYGPQVVMLSPVGGDFFLRANIWPSVDEHMVRASGSGAFVYGLPHDHNFHFLTLGYFGPGYWSDYYEFDYATLAGSVDEPAGLRFIERSRLEEGKLMLYRAHLDVHAQIPPDALSVSINVMHAGGAQGWLDQYSFDTDRNVISGVLGHGTSEVFLRLAVGLGGDEALDMASRFAARHPSDRMRLAALEAQAGVLGPAERDELWRRAEVSPNRLISLEARRRRAVLEVA